MDVFMQLFQSNISQWFHKLQALYLCQNNANYLVYHIYKKKMIMKTFNVSKPKKSEVHFPKFQTVVYFKIR